MYQVSYIYTSLLSLQYSSSFAAYFSVARATGVHTEVGQVVLYSQVFWKAVSGEADFASNCSFQNVDAFNFAVPIVPDENPL